MLLVNAIQEFRTLVLSNGKSLEYAAALDILEELLDFDQTAKLTKRLIMNWTTWDYVEATYPVGVVDLNRHHFAWEFYWWARYSDRTQLPTQFIPCSGLHLLKHRN